jgi:hypothetical protein
MDAGPPSDWADFAQELPPDHPVVVALGEPGEVFWSELAVLDWGDYLATIERSDRWTAIERVSRKVILSNRRMVVLRLEGGDVEYVSLPLRIVHRVRVEVPEGLDYPGHVESIVHVESRIDESVGGVDWATRTPDAHVFARKLADLVKTCRQLIKDGDWPDDTGLADRGRLRLDDFPRPWSQS